MEEAIVYILEKKSGYRKELIEKYGEDFVNELAMLGYITQGATFVEEGYERTWKKTKKAGDYFRFFIKELTTEEKERGCYLSSLGFLMQSSR